MGGQKLESTSIKIKLIKISFPVGLLIFSLFLAFPSPVKSAYYDFGLLSNVYLCYNSRRPTWVNQGIQIPPLCSLGNSQTSFSGLGTPLINDYNTTQYKGSPQYTLFKATSNGKISKLVR